MVIRTFDFEIVFAAKGYTFSFVQVRSEIVMPLRIIHIFTFVPNTCAVWNKFATEGYSNFPFSTKHTCRKEKFWRWWLLELTLLYQIHVSAGIVMPLTVLRTF